MRPPPPDAEQDDDSLEMLHGWVVDGELQVTLAAWVWTDEPEQWGRLLADSACHLADAISKETGNSRDEIFRAILESLVHHLGSPHGNLEGENVEPLDPV